MSAVDSSHSQILAIYVLAVFNSFPSVGALLSIPHCFMMLGLATASYAHIYCSESGAQIGCKGELGNVEKSKPSFQLSLSPKHSKILKISRS